MRAEGLYLEGKNQSAYCPAGYPHGQCGAKRRVLQGLTRGVNSCTLETCEVLPMLGLLMMRYVLEESNLVFHKPLWLNSLG
jgi:hypothetical protein